MMGYLLAVFVIRILVGTMLYGLGFQLLVDRGQGGRGGGVGREGPGILAVKQKRTKINKKYPCTEKQM